MVAADHRDLAQDPMCHASFAVPLTGSASSLVARSATAVVHPRSPARVVRTSRNDCPAGRCRGAVARHRSRRSQVEPK